MKQPDKSPVIESPPLIDLAEKQEALAVRQPTFVEMIDYAVKNNGAIEVIERLAALQQVEIDRRAKNEYSDAMHAAQSEISNVKQECPVGVAKEMFIPSAKRKHARDDRLRGRLRARHNRRHLTSAFCVQPK